MNKEPTADGTLWRGKWLTFHTPSRVYALPLAQAVAVLAPVPPCLTLSEQRALTLELAAYRAQAVIVFDLEALLYQSRATGKAQFLIVFDVDQELYGLRATRMAAIISATFHQSAGHPSSLRGSPGPLALFPQELRLALAIAGQESMPPPDTAFKGARPEREGPERAGNEERPT